MAGGGMAEEINHALLARLYGRPHPLLASTSEACCAVATTYQARIAHHLLDMAGIPQGDGSDSQLDARVWLTITRMGRLEDRLSRIASWHSREAGPAGTVGNYCIECGRPWPCDTRRMADGTAEPDAELS